MEDEGREEGKDRLTQRWSLIPLSHRQLTVLFPRLGLGGGKVPCPHPEQESSALLPAKGRQIKAARGTRQPCEEIEGHAMMSPGKPGLGQGDFWSADCLPGRAVTWTVGPGKVQLVEAGGREEEMNYQVKRASQAGAVRAAPRLGFCCTMGLSRTAARLTQLRQCSGKLSSSNSGLLVPKVLPSHHPPREGSAGMHPNPQSQEAW